jgi:Protein of unknown function (DUF2975)
MTTVRLSPLLAALTWVALGGAMIFVAGVAIGILSYADVLFGFLPDFAFARGPLIALELAFGICIEVLLVVTGVLVGYIVADRIFRPSAPRWANALVAAAAVATVLVFATLFFIPGPPQLSLFMVGAVAVGATIVLVLLVLRSLLRRAVSINVELEEVV